MNRRRAAPFAAIHTGNCTHNIAYSIVKVQMGINPFVKKQLIQTALKKQPSPTSPRGHVSHSPISHGTENGCKSIPILFLVSDISVATDVLSLPDVRPPHKRCCGMSFLHNTPSRLASFAANSEIPKPGVPQR